jgi:hypothetical protein
MDILPKCFVAYPSAPLARAEAVENAIDLVGHNGVVDIKAGRAFSPVAAPLSAGFLKKSESVSALLQI